LSSSTGLLEALSRPRDSSWSLEEGSVGRLRVGAILGPDDGMIIETELVVKPLRSHGVP
jgi:hypothetical protein